MALSDDLQRERRPRGPWTYSLKNDAVIYSGAMVCRDSNGEALPAADTAGLQFLGVNYGDRVDNADDGLSVKVDNTQIFLADIAAAAADDLGKLVYAVDDTTVGLAADVTNLVTVGRIVGIKSATQVWVDPWQSGTPTASPESVSATSTNAIMSSIVASDLPVASTVLSASFSATPTSAELRAFSSIVNSILAGASKIGTEGEKVGDDARATIAALTTMGLFT